MAIPTKIITRNCWDTAW